VGEQRVREAAKRDHGDVSQKVRGRTKIEFQREEDLRTTATTVVQRPQEQGAERAAKLNRITVNRRARSRLRQDMTAQRGGQSRSAERGGIRKALEHSSWRGLGAHAFSLCNAALKETEELTWRTKSWAQVKSLGSAWHGTARRRRRWSQPKRLGTREGRTKSERNPGPEHLGSEFWRGFATRLKPALRCERVGGCRVQVFSKRARAFWAFCLAARGRGPRTEGP
jgi:hypothetical protein